MFYLDNNILNMESNHEYIKIIKYLEDLFLKENKVDIFLSIIGYSWYFFVEGLCLSPTLTNDDLDYFKNSWSKYHDIGLRNYKSNDEVCFLLGYTFYLHGFFITNKSNNESIGLKLIEESKKITKNDELKFVLEIFINRHKNKKIEKINHLSKLFNSKSILDTYFKEIFYNL